MTKLIKWADLLPGDILLAHGNDYISDLIEWIDGSPYSHAILYWKNGFFEADFDGVTFKQGFKKIKTDEKWVHVYRFEKQGQQLGSPSYPADPIQIVGKSYVDKGSKYAFDDIIFLAIQVVTRKIPFNALQKEILRTYLDKASAIVEKLIHNKRTPLVCSELVYRCFLEAVNPPDYSLRIAISGKVSTPPKSSNLAKKTLFSPTRVPIPMSKVIYESSLKKNSIMPIKNFIKKIKNSPTLDIEFTKSKAKFLDSWSRASEPEITKAYLTSSIRPHLMAISNKINPSSVVRAKVMPASGVTPRDLASSPDIKFIGELQLP